jgi:hypothetical protein
LRPYLEKTAYKKGLVGVSQVVDPELKPQYCKRERERERERDTERLRLRD